MSRYNPRRQIRDAIARATLAGLLLAIFFAAGCASTPDSRPADSAWTQEYLDAMRLDYEAADEALADLIERAPATEQRREVEFERARLAQDADKIELARQRFQEIFDADPDDNVASRSLYELGRIAADHDRDEDEARRLYAETITETAPWAGTEFALSALIRQERRADRIEGLVDLLEELISQVDDDRLAVQLHLERGLLLDEELRRPDLAIDDFRATFTRCEECSATEEALFQMGSIYARHQNWDAAVAAYEIVANRTGRSFFIGNYHSQRASDARYELAMIEMLFRQDYDAAADHFDDFLGTFPGNPKSDLVAWHLVEIERLNGSQRSYRRALERFIDDYPDSRRTEAARKKLAEAT